jgi:hypothetical protein
MGWIPPAGRAPLEEAFHVFDYFPRRARHVHDSTQLAAIPHSVRKPAGELLHFSHGIGRIGVQNLSVVARQ